MFPTLKLSSLSLGLLGSLPLNCVKAIKQSNGARLNVPKMSTVTSNHSGAMIWLVESSDYLTADTSIYRLGKFN